MIFVTGYFGAPIRGCAREISKDKGYALIDLDERVEAIDGRSIRRLCMMNGEHGYRNKEYEALKEIADGGDRDVVIACGDGVLLDEMSRELILREGQLIIAGKDMTEEALWESAKSMDDTYHAFMHFGSEDQKREAFGKHFERQKKLFGGI